MTEFNNENIVKDKPKADERVQHSLPGLVDLQVNGHGGIDFNHEPLDDEDLLRVCQSLRAEGVVAFLPTLITGEPVVVERLARRISDAADRIGATADQAVRAAAGVPLIAGLHLEGPFFSPQDGARGAQPREWIRPPDLDWVRRVNDVTGGRVCLLTLSPEWEGSTAFIETLVDMGIRVSIGHTAATAEQIDEAVRAGADLSTHLGNGLPPMMDRHANPVWPQLANDGLWASVIGDGFHLPRTFFETVRKIKGDRMILVSDGTSFTGCAAGTYRAPIGGEVVLTLEGRLHMKGNPALMAGSAMSLRRIVEGLAARGWMDFADAWTHASTVPWKYLGLPGPHVEVDVEVS